MYNQAHASDVVMTSGNVLRQLLANDEVMELLNSITHPGLEDEPGDLSLGAFVRCAILDVEAWEEDNPGGP